MTQKEIEEIVSHEIIDLLREQYPWKSGTKLQHRGSVWMIDKLAQAIHAKQREEEAELREVWKKYDNLSFMPKNTKDALNFIDEFIVDSKKALNNFAKKRGWE